MMFCSFSNVGLPFFQYGPVIDVIVSLKKNGLGIVEFKEPLHAVRHSAG